MILSFKKKAKPVLYWKDCEIPAKTFFKILYENEYHLLGTLPDNKLQAAFEVIFDEYVRLDNNEKVIAWYKKRCKITMLTLQINHISNIMYAISYLPLTTEQRIDIIDKLNNINGVIVKFNKDKPLLEEIHRVSTIVLGALKNRLNIEKTTEKTQEENVKYSFEKDLVSVENVLGRSIDDVVTLKKFIELKQSAYRLAEARKPKNKRHGK